MSRARAMTTSVEAPPRSTSAHSLRAECRLAAPKKLKAASRRAEMMRTGVPMTSLAWRTKALPSEAWRAAWVAQAINSS